MAKAKTAADNLCERLIEWGVTTIYGFPGDGINGILGSLRRHQEQLRFIPTRHEEMASFMACGHAKFTGQVGVCMATSGPGAIHLLNGLYDAKLDHQPVVAIVGQTFVCVIVPADVQDKEAVEEQPKATHTVHTGVGWWKPRVIPTTDQLRQAADIPQRGREKVAMLVGAGAFLPTTGQVKAVQIDLAPRMLSIRYPMDLALVGDAKDTLSELLSLLQRKSDRSWQDKIVGNVKQWWALMDDEGQPSDLDGRIRPQGLFACLSRHLPDQAILSSDSGTAADWYASHIRIRRGMKASLSGNLATMVPGVPYGMAAKFAFPDRVSVAMVGDGAMQMGGMAEVLTAAKYYKTGADPRYVVVVLNNEDLNQVTWEQRAMEGDPHFDASQSIAYVSYADWAQLIGLKGIKVTRSDQIEAAFAEAFAANRPVIVDALTTADEPPMPPHVTFKQARALMTSVERTRPGGWPGPKRGCEIAKVEGTDFDFRDGKRLGEQKLDTPFTDLDRDQDGRAWVRLTAPDTTRTELWVDQHYPIIEIFTGDTLGPTRRRTGLGTEPMTCPPNAFQSGNGLTRLEPSQSLTTTWGVRLNRHS